MRVRRLAVALLLPLAIIPTFLAQPADAHTLTGVQPTNFRSEMVSILPALPGVTVEILDLGRRIRLTNDSRTELVVHGYQGEPYLRVGPDGVFENTHSPAVYLNQPAPPYATTSTTLPRAANASAPPTWRRVSRSDTATWHDRRTRWEGPSPASVRTAPHDRQVVSPWIITVTRGSVDAAITGRILWVPPPSAIPWLVLAVVLGVATAAMVFTRRWATSLAIALTVLVASDIVHSVSSAWATHDGVGAVLFRVFVSGFYGTIAWVLGLFSIRLVARRQDLGLLLGGITAFFLALLGGATDAASLGRSQLSFSLPSDVARAQIALALGIGIGLVAAVGWLLGRGDERVVRTRPRPA